MRSHTTPVTATGRCCQVAQRWRLIDSGPSEPGWNMAVDEALVTKHAQGGLLPVLRLYAWSPPALSRSIEKTAGSTF